MDDTIKQITTTIGNAANIMVLIPAGASLDASAAANVLAGLAARAGKNIVTVSLAAVPPLPFISRQTPVQQTIEPGDEFAIKVSNTHAQPGELRYELVQDGLVIFLKSKQGEFQAGDVSVSAPMKKADLLVTLGVQNLEQLGQLYTEHSALFFEIPILNIDRHPGNDYYGTINYVQVKAASLCEMLYEVAAASEGALQDADISTALLAGIIEQTHSFRDPKTTPATLSKAAQLISAGAKQQDIIQHLYKTKPFQTLQLWGRALARLVAVPEQSLFYSAVTKSDIEKTGGTHQALVEVLRELVEMVSTVSVVALAAELPEGLTLFVAALPHVGISSLIQKMNLQSSPVLPLVGNFEFTAVPVPSGNLLETQQLVTQALAKP